jgi:hypothetical protein
MEFTFTSTLDASQHGRGMYYHISVPKDTSSVFDDLPILRGGFKSLKCTATIGDSSWTTSVFPDKDEYLLLVAKKWVEAEKLGVGDPVEVTLRMN